MIATRFRSVYWVGGVAVAALGCYLVSQRVASERATLTRTEAAIITGKRDIRALETEIGTRAGMNQIERWNTEVLSLAAPKASQFLASEVQLAALVQPTQPAMQAPAVLQASVAAPLAGAARVTTVAYAPDAQAKPVATDRPAAPRLAAEEAPVTHRAKPRPEAQDAPAARRAAPKLAAAEAPARHASVKLAQADAPRHAAVKLAAADAPASRRAAPKLANDDAPASRSARVTRVNYVPTARPAGVRLASDGDEDQPRVRPAVYMRPGRDHQNVALLDDRVLSDLDRIAASERAGGKRSR